MRNTKYLFLVSGVPERRAAQSVDHCRPHPERQQEGPPQLHQEEAQGDHRARHRHGCGVVTCSVIFYLVKIGEWFVSRYEICFHPLHEDQKG